MRIVLQRVKSAQVTVDNKVIGEIGRGYLLLLGIGKNDQEKDIDWLVKKILSLRLFEAENGDSFLERNIKEVNGSILLISQFTLYGDCKKGTRPDFGSAASSGEAIKLYEKFAQKIKNEGIDVKTGKFGAKMELDLINIGPVTLIMES